jgi:hypothetical protein
MHTHIIPRFQVNRIASLTKLKKGGSMRWAKKLGNAGAFALVLWVLRLNQQVNIYRATLRRTQRDLRDQVGTNRALRWELDDLKKRRGTSEYRANHSLLRGRGGLRK